nr:immunoglobulin light chain junction region [Macaca mulatta]MOV78613.1 immunoglobulin light chain junction region [Macaca mulatta]MOV78633.1 immunoglobulin light chain junction region [Macaca mulatta]MOV78809.1 immunoglobulin light chain junction region [Macaca mulatta]MOV81064.1 immunoglobulin light chain junction region [Macaca mulatta]
CHQHNSFPYSF